MFKRLPEVAKLGRKRLTVVHVLVDWNMIPMWKTINATSQWSIIHSTEIIIGFDKIYSKLAVWPFQYLK